MRKPDTAGGKPWTHQLHQKEGGGRGMTGGEHSIKYGNRKWLHGNRRLGQESSKRVWEETGSHRSLSEKSM